MGKSTVAAMFADLGVPIFDADAVVRQLQGPGGALLPMIEDAFPGTTGPDGVDRGALGEMVFGKTDELARLEQARELLSTQMDRALTLAYLSAAVGLGEHRLKQGFRAVFGTTPQALLLELRMRRACDSTSAAAASARVTCVLYVLKPTASCRFCMRLSDAFMRSSARCCARPNASVAPPGEAATGRGLPVPALAEGSCSAASLLSAPNEGTDAVPRDLIPDAADLIPDTNSSRSFASAAVSFGIEAEPRIM